MLIYGRDKGRREICSNIFDIKAFPLYTLPETIQGIRTLSFSDMEYAAASQVHDDCLVNMPFPDGKLINANAIDIIQRRWCIMTLQISRMDILDCIPGHAQQIGGILQGNGFQQPDHVPGKTMRITTAACGKGNSLLVNVIAILVLALATLYFHAENHLLSTYGKADKVT